MKKIIVAAAAALMAFGAQAAYKDGSYTGEGNGREGVITVQVDVAGGKISNVKVVKHNDTEMIIQAPIDEVLPAVVQKQGTEGVEPVSGATLSSNGIIEAVKNALAKAQ